MIVIDPATLEALLSLGMFVTLFGMILSGYPVAFTIAGTALVFATIGAAFGLFQWSDLFFLPNRIWGIISNYTLVAVPLFVFMGIVLAKSGVAEDLLGQLTRVFRKRKASLGVAVVLVGALLAASTGIVGATVVTMGVLTLPTMLREGYDKSIATGTIAASGTLGQIIPPSIVLVLLGDMMNVDVGDLFVGALLPGLVLVGLYIAYLKYCAWRFPERTGGASQPSPSKNSNSLEDSDGSETQDRGAIFSFLKVLVPPVVLMTVVLGSILFGIASPTEAAACGATGALVIALCKRRLSWQRVQGAASETVDITSMVFLLLIGAQFFGVVFRGLGGDELITNFVLSLDLPRAAILVAMMVLFFVLGFFLDFLEICFIVIPIIQPIMIKLGYDPLWLAVLIAVNLQTSFLTPPFGFALFYLKGVAPPEIQTADIYRGVIPFIGIQLFCILLLAVFPALVLWLPSLFFAP